MASHGIDVSRDDAGAEPSPIATLPPARRVAVILASFTATLSAALIYDVLPPIIANVAALFGGGPHGSLIAQLASTLPLFGVVIGGLISGPVSERIGLRPTLLLAMLVFGVAGAAGIAIDFAVPFLATRALMGLASGVMTTCCTALVALFFRGAGRARMNGLLVSAGAVGGVAFVLLAGLTAQWWWRAPFLLHAAVVLVFLLPVLLTGPVPQTVPATQGAIGNLRRLAPILPVCATGFAWFVLMLMAGVKAPFVMAEAGIHDHATIAAIYAINAGSVTVSSLLFGQIAGRFSPVAVLRLSFLMQAVALCVIGSAATIPHFAIGLLLSGTTAGIALTAVWTWGMRRAPHDLVARALGVMTTSLYLGGAMSTLLIAPFQAGFGTRGQFFVIAGLTVVLVALLWLVLRGRQAGAPA